MWLRKTLKTHSTKNPQSNICVEASKDDPGITTLQKEDKSEVYTVISSKGVDHR